VGRRKELQQVIPDEAAIRPALEWAAGMIRRGLPAGPVRLSIGRPRRTLDQNSKLWAMLSDVSRQVDWYGQKLTPENWKDVFTAALKRQAVVPGIEGGFVVLGTSTSRMEKQEMVDLIELMLAFGAERGVVWSEPKN
jgi:hypothetical protein